MKFFADAIATASAQTFAFLATVLVQVILVRNVDQPTYGTYSIALSIQNLIEAVVVPRSGEISIRVISEQWRLCEYGKARTFAWNRERSDVYVNAVTYFVVLIFLVILNVALLKQSNVFVGLVAILGASVLAQSGYGVSKAVLISAGRVKQMSRVDLSASVAFLVISLLLIPVVGVFGAAIGLVSGSAVKTYFSRQQATRCFEEYCKSTVVNKQPDYGELQKGLTLQSLLRNTFVSAFGQVDILLLGFFSNASDVAHYRVAKTVMSVPAKVFAPVWAASRPAMITGLYSERRLSLAHLTGLVAIATVGVVGLSSSGAKEVLTWLVREFFGSSYGPSVEISRTLLVGGWLFYGCSGWFSFFTLISRNNELGTKFYCISVCFLTIGAYLFGRSSATKMATVLATVLFFMSLFAWMLLIREVVGSRRR